MVDADVYATKVKRQSPSVFLVAVWLSRGSCSFPFLSPGPLLAGVVVIADRQVSSEPGDPGHDRPAGAQGHRGVLDRSGDQLGARARGPRAILLLRRRTGQALLWLQLLIIASVGWRPIALR